MTRLEYMRKVREAELSLVLPLFEPRCRILEIGAGAGWQARFLSERGFDVEAIDIDTPIEDGQYGQAVWNSQKDWPVKIYDGVTIPFEDASFDLVFSSNVLEHIPNVEIFQFEIQRVLKKGGKSVHLIPTPTFRIFASLAHLPKTALELLSPHLRDHQARKILVPEGTPAPKSDTPKPSMLTRMVRRLIPPRHGARGNFMSEIFLFSRHRWLKLFKSRGWVNVEVAPTRIFYMPFLNMFALPSKRASRILSLLFGSSCLIYTMEK